MKKIKKFFKEHRIFTMLMAVVVVCLVLIITVLINVFYMGNGSNKYGNRLEGIENVKISSSKLSDFENNVANNDKVKNVEIRIQGKIIYITMQIEQGVKLEEAEGIALKSLENFSEEERAFYDFNITLKQNSTENSDGFIISGAKNKNGTGLIWNNNRVVEDEDTSA
jgi:hypothetical protein